MWIKLQSTMLNTDNISFIGVQKSPKDANKWAVMIFSTDNVKFVVTEGSREHCYGVLDKLSSAINEKVWSL